MSAEPLNLLSIRNILKLPLRSVLGTNAGIESQIRLLRAAVKGRLAEGAGWVALDFFGIQSIPKSRFWDSFLNDLAEIIADDPRLTLVNVPTDAAASMAIGKLIAPAVVPVIDILGCVSWIGCTEHLFRSALHILWERGTLCLDELEVSVAGNKRSVSRLKRLLARNPHMAELDEASGTWIAKLTRCRTDAFLREAFESWFREESCVARKTGGHFELPSGRHTNTYFQTDLFLKNPDTVWALAMELCRRFASRCPDVILAYSLLGFAIASEICEILRVHGTSVVQIPCYDYPIPHPRLGDGVRPGQSVLILTDIISSGTAITNLRSYARTHGARSVTSVAVIDINSLYKRLDADALFSVDIQVVQEGSQCPLCREGVPLSRIDRFTSAPLAPLAGGVSPAPAVMSNDFWQMAIDSDAIRRGHLSFNGHHFTLFVEMPRILKNQGFSDRLANEILASCARRRIRPDFIVYPNQESALAFACALRRNSRKHVTLVPAYRTPDDGSYRLTATDAEVLLSRKRPTVLVVDDGVNFGSVLLGIHFAVEGVFVAAKHRQYVLAYAVVLDRLQGTYEKTVTAVLKSAVISVCRLEAPPPYHEWDCPQCRKLRELVLRAKDAPRAMATYYEKEAKRFEVRPVDQQIHER